jgi:DNA repair protein RadB
MIKFPTGVGCIDKLLGGGIERGTITQLYGGPSTGKTNICIQTAIRAAESNHKVVYVDTEGLSPERVKQIGGRNVENILGRIILYEPYDFKQQMTAIKNLKKISQAIDLVIIDSFTGLYRSELEDSEKNIKLRRELTSQLTFLLGLARKNNLGVLITNQVFTDIDKDEERPLGGVGIEHLSKVVIKLVRKNSHREAVLIKHRHKKEGERCQFTIDESGVF